MAVKVNGTQGSDAPKSPDPTSTQAPVPAIVCPEVKPAAAANITAAFATGIVWYYTVCGDAIDL